MTEFAIRVYVNADDFAEDWQALGYDAMTASAYWMLLGELASGELLIHLPEWLAAEKVGYLDGATPTAFVGRIVSESEQAIRVTDTAAAHPLSQLAARIHSLQDSIARLEREGTADSDRLAWLERRLAEKRAALGTRSERPSLTDEWLPKSQIEFIGRRAPGD